MSNLTKKTNLIISTLIIGGVSGIEAMQNVNWDSLVGCPIINAQKAQAITKFCKDQYENREPQELIDILNGSGNDDQKKQILITFGPNSANYVKSIVNTTYEAISQKYKKVVMNCLIQLDKNKMKDKAIARSRAISDSSFKMTNDELNSMNFTAIINETAANNAAAQQINDQTTLLETKLQDLMTQFEEASISLLNFDESCSALMLFLLDNSSLIDKAIALSYTGTKLIKLQQTFIPTVTPGKVVRAYIAMVQEIIKAKKKSTELDNVVLVNYILQNYNTSLRNFGKAGDFKGLVDYCIQQIRENALQQL